MKKIYQFLVVFILSGFFQISSAVAQTGADPLDVLLPQTTPQEAQQINPPSQPAAQNLTSPQPTNVPTPRIQPSAVDSRPPFAKFFMMSNRFSRAFLEDGFPLRKEAFMFTEVELLKTDDIETMRSALNREQRRLTRIFLSEHPIFKQYSPGALDSLVSEVAAANEKSLKEAKTMVELNNLNFDDFRQHLIRVSNFILFTRHIEYINPTGIPDIKEPAYMPKTVFDYAALGSLVLNLILLMMLVVVRRT